MSPQLRSDLVELAANNAELRDKLLGMLTKVQVFRQQIAVQRGAS